MRPDLRWIQDQLAGEGLLFDNYRNQEQGFACQCPVHRGEGKSARFAVRNGILLFTCYAYHCDFKAMKNALDLTDGDCYAEHILRDRERTRGATSPNYKPVANASDVVAFAEAAMSEGQRLTESQLREYRAALIRQHKGVAA